MNGNKALPIFLLKKSRSTLLMGLTISLWLFLSLFPREASAHKPLKQERTINGVVADRSGEELIGVSVRVKGTSVGAMTDTKGRFAIGVPAGRETLVFTYLGYNQKEVILKDNNQLTVILEAKDTFLEEVVVIGYGTQKKKLITGATVQIKGENVEKLNTVNALGALQSQAPGVNITQASGMPGEGYKVVIRGLGTVGNASPLYVIDGSPGGSINDLNPSDIESIDVLKDAASAAIYGSRAANGVILITTKQGKKGKPQVSLSMYKGVQNLYRMPDILNAKEYSVIMNEGRLMDGLSPYNFEKDVPDWDKVVNGSWNGTNWLDLARNKNAPVENYTLNVTGGTEQSTYSLGFGYTSQEGILGKPVEPYFNRLSTRVNSEHTLFTIGKRDLVKVGENITYSYTENSGIAIGDTWSNDVRNLIKGNPLLPNKTDSGNYSYAIPWEIRAANPIAHMEARSHSISKNHNLKANFYLTVQPVKGLSLKSLFGYTLNTGSYRSFTPKYALSSTVFNSLEAVSQSMWSGIGVTWENTMSHEFKLNKHRINSLLGQSIESTGIGENLNGSNGSPIFHDLKHAYLNNAPLKVLNAATALGGSPWGSNKLSSFFGRINYDYDDKYLLTLVLRADGSSIFAKGHRWGSFPSASAGWIISSEEFMKDTRSVIDFLKVRVSWGQNGNQAIPAFQYLSTIANDASYTFGNDKGSPTLGSYPDILPNPNISWETSEQTDVGLDANLFRSRLGVVLDYYVKTTKDWLVQVPHLASYGTGAPYSNGGDVTNKGIEVALNWNDNLNGFKYGGNISLSYNTNKITRLSNTEGVIHGATDALFQGSTESYRAQVGLPIGFFYGYKTAGVFQTAKDIEDYKGAKLPSVRPGDVIWVDRNNDGKISDEDQGIIGDPHPDYTLGFGLNASYQGFDLSVALSGAFGHQIFKSYRAWNDMPKENHTSEIFGRWHGAGTSNRLPRLTSNSHTNWNYVSDLYIENGDYVRMQNLTLGYDLKRAFPKMFFQQTRLYFTAQNLFTLTKYTGMDPEVGFGHDVGWVSGIDTGFYPSPRTYMLGLNIKF